MVDEILKCFPKLRGSPFAVTRPATGDYNCVAWAAGDTGAWWWPDPDPDNEAIYWPAGAPREETLPAFAAAFATLGYVPCGDDTAEPGYQKVALFAGADGVPTHAARQLPSGRWTSKLGFLEDSEHVLDALSGAAYGTVVMVLKRPLLPASGRS